MIPHIGSVLGDIVFLLDVSGSMEKSLKLIKEHLSGFQHELKKFFQSRNNHLCRDAFLSIRYKLVGYRDHIKDGDKWFIEFPFVNNIEDIKKQMDHPDMQSKGGGDEPESLLDAIYKLGIMPESPIDINNIEGEFNKWRGDLKFKLSDHSYRTFRVYKFVIVITDATFHKKATLPEIKDLDASGVYEKISSAKLRLFGLVPEWEGYLLIGSFPYSTLEYYIKGDSVAKLGEDSAEGRKTQEIAVEALAKYLVTNDHFMFGIIEDLVIGDDYLIKPESVE